MLLSTSGSGSRPLLYPVAAWSGTAPAHAITSIAVETLAQQQQQGNYTKHRQRNDSTPPLTASQLLSSRLSSLSPSFPLLLPPSASIRSLMTGSASGELVSWECLPGFVSALTPASVHPSPSRFRPRSLCFHVGCAEITALTCASLGNSSVMVSASREGFISLWSASGGRCRRSALVLPFAATYMVPIYLWTATGAATEGERNGSQLTASPPPAGVRYTTFLIACGHSPHVYLLRMPKLRVVGILQHENPLVSACMSIDPRMDGGRKFTQSGKLTSTGSGPFLATLDNAGTVSMWKLSEFVGPKRALSVAPMSPTSIPRPVTPNPSASGSLTATATYIANGIQCHTVPQRMFGLPHAIRDNLETSDPWVVELDVLNKIRHMTSLPADLPPLQYTSLALSHDVIHILVTNNQHFMILSTQHLHLEMNIQSVVHHLEQKRQLTPYGVAVEPSDKRVDSKAANANNEEFSSVLHSWSDTDCLIGCGFLSDYFRSDDSDAAEGDDVLLGHKRFAVWSEEGGIWIFKLYKKDSSQQHHSGAPQQPASSNPTPVTPNSVILSNPALHVELFAFCHLKEIHFVPSTNQSQTHVKSSVPLLIPSSIRVEGHRIICGNSEGGLYQFVIPVSTPQLSALVATPIDPTSSSSSTVPIARALNADSADSDLDAMEYHYDAATQIWHIYPSQIIDVASAFEVSHPLTAVNGIPPPPPPDEDEEQAPSHSGSTLMVPPQGKRSSIMSQLLTSQKYNAPLPPPPAVPSANATQFAILSPSQQPQLTPMQRLANDAHISYRNSRRSLSHLRDLRLSLIQTQGIDLNSVHDSNQIMEEKEEEEEDDEKSGAGSDDDDIPPPPPDHFSTDADGLPPPPPPRASIVPNLRVNVPYPIVAEEVATPADDCISTLMLVDSNRKEVTLAKGYKSGTLQLVNIAGPVHGALNSAYQAPKSGTDRAKRIEIPHAHGAAILCMASVEKKQSVGDFCILLLVTGSLDGSAKTWDAHTGHAIHSFRCGSPVLAIYQPITFPTIAALVEAQRAGMLYPSTSDRVPASHRLPVNQNLVAKEQLQEKDKDRGSTLTLNADLYDPTALSDANSLDYDSIYRTPSSDQLFFVCADRCIRSCIVEARENSWILGHLQSSPFAPEMTAAQLERQGSRFMQVYRGHAAPVTAVFFNSFAAENDLLVSQTEGGAVYVFTLSTGTLEQCIEDPTEAATFLQSYDLVKAHSQISCMAYQLRQLASFAPGLFQLAIAPELHPHPSDGHAALPAPALLRAESEHGHHKSKSTPSKMSLKALSFARSAVKHMTSKLRRRSSSSGQGPIFGSSSLGSSSYYATDDWNPDANVDVATQNHILSTFILNRFLFHQQNPSFNASILSSVTGGSAAAGDGSVRNGSAAVVYRPSILRRAANSHAPQCLKTVDLHVNPMGSHTSLEHRFNHLQLAVYSLDIQQLTVDLLTRYSALASSTFSRTSSSGNSPGGVSSGDTKKDLQASWHSLLAPLFDWDGPNSHSTNSVANLLLSHANFPLPISKEQSYAVFSDRAQAISVLFPSYSHSHRRWTFDPEATALHLLSVSSVLSSLVQATDSSCKNSFDKVTSYYQNHLPRALSSFVEADLTYLALYALNTSEHVHLAARSLMQGVIERASSEQRAAWWREWGSLYQVGPYASAGQVDGFWKRNLFSLHLLKREEVSGALAASAAGVASAKDVPFLKRGLLNSNSTSNLFGRRNSISLTAGALAGPAPTGLSGTNGSPNRDQAAGASTNSNSLPPLLPEFVSDKEFMTLFVLVTLYIFEHNSWKWTQAEEKYKDMLNMSSSAEQGASSMQSEASKTPPVLLLEMEQRLPMIVHSLLRQLAYNSHTHAPIVAPTELVKLSLACEILSRGLSSFQRYIPVESLPLLIRRLQYLSLNSSLVERSFHQAPATAVSSSSATTTSSSASAAAHMSANAMANGPGNVPGSVDSSPWLALHIQLYHSARKLLLEIGKIYPDLYMYIVGKEILLRHLKSLLPVERSNYTMNMISLVRKYPKAVNRVLLDTVHTLIKLVHPGETPIRAQFLSPVTEYLRTIENLYPKASFSENTGRFAIGTNMYTYHAVSGTSSTVAKGSADSPQSVMGEAGATYRPEKSNSPFSIMIFDLKTAGKFRILEGHKAEVTAVAFNATGTLIASYSARDVPSPTLKIWKLGESGLLDNLIHSHGKVIKNWVLPAIDLNNFIRRELSVAQKQSFVNQQRKVSVQQERIERSGLQVPFVQLDDEDGSGSNVSTAPSTPLTRTPAVSMSMTRRPSFVNQASSSALHASKALTGISGAQLDEEDETEESLLLSRMLSVRLKWTSAETLSLTREDGTTASWNQAE